MTPTQHYQIEAGAFEALVAASLADLRVEIEVRANGDCYVVIAGDIGDDQREVEYEPLTAPSVPEPIRTPAPAEPVRTPEKVPA